MRSIEALDASFASGITSCSLSWLLSAATSSVQIIRIE
jgi:hypothetical protein